MQSFDQDREITTITIQLISVNSSLNHLTALSLRVSQSALSSEYTARSQDSSQNPAQTVSSLSPELTAMRQQDSQDVVQARPLQVPSSFQRSCDSSGLQHSLIWKDVWLHSGQATLMVSSATISLN